MPSTPVYTLPYPASSDPPDIPTDMQELAERIELVLAEIERTVIATGMLGSTMSPSAPDGWLLCNGLPIPAEHTELIALIGPNTPDLLGCVIVGYNVADPNFSTIGQKGGEPRVQLQIGEMPAHNHDFAEIGGIALRRLAKQKQEGGGATDIVRVGGADSPVTVRSQGSSHHHNNLQPYFAADIIIKY